MGRKTILFGREFIFLLVLLSVVTLGDSYSKKFTKRDTSGDLGLGESPAYVTDPYDPYGSYSGQFEQYQPTHTQYGPLPVQEKSYGGSPIYSGGYSDSGIVSSIQGYWDQVKIFDPKKMSTGLWILAGFLIALGVAAIINTLLTLASLALAFFNSLGKGTKIIPLLLKLLLSPLISRTEIEQLTEGVSSENLGQTVEVVSRMLRKARKLYEDSAQQTPST